ncbi:MAG: hypothetical protein IJ306_01190 [Oscillospiraceae bacterium]|nr:hypothetical protein [Oscillospiraceae bacterium]
MATGIEGLKEKAQKNRTVNMLRDIAKEVHQKAAEKEAAEERRLYTYNTKEAQEERYRIKQELDSLGTEYEGTTAGVVASSLDPRKGTRGPVETDAEKKAELERKLLEIERDITLAKRIQNGDFQRRSAIEAPDFEKYSQIEVPKEDVRIKPHQQNIQREDSAMKYMDEEQQGIYNYYYAKFGKERAKEYLDTIRDDLNRKQAQAIYSGNEDNIAAQYLIGAQAGFNQAKTGFQGAIRMIMGDDTYQPPSTEQYLAGLARQDLSDDGKLPSWISNIIGAESIGQLGFDLIKTGTNMVPSVVIGMATGGIGGAAAMGSSATGNAYNEMIGQGYSGDQAANYSLLVGASETVLSYLLSGVGALGGKVTNSVLGNKLAKIDGVFKKVAASLPAKMASEGVEEYLQEILDPVFRNYVFNEENEIDPFSQEAIYSFVLGALSAGPFSAAETIGANYDAKQTYGEFENELVEEGLSAPQDSAANRLAKIAQEKIAGGKKLSGRELRKLADENAKAIEAEPALADEKEIIAESATVDSGEKKASYKGAQGLVIATGRNHRDTIEKTASHFVNATAETGKQIAQAYNPEDGVSVETFLEGVNEAYRYGTYNFPIEEMNSGGSFIKDITEAQKMSGYYLGKENARKALIAEAEKEQKKVLPGIKGKVVYEGAARLGVMALQQKATVELIDRLSEYTGIEYHIFTSIVKNGKRGFLNSEGRFVELSANGFYDPVKHQIWIDTNAGSREQGIMLYTLTHEHVHDIKVWSAEHYNKLVKITSAAFEKSGKSFEEAVAVKLEQYRKDHPETDESIAQEEIIAETMSGLLRDGKALSEFSEQIYKEDRTLWEKIKDWFKGIIAKITEAYKDFAPESEEAKMLMEQKELFEEAQKVFAEAVATAAENYKNAGVQSTTSQVNKADTNAKFQARNYDESQRNQVVLEDQRKYVGKVFFENSEIFSYEFLTSLHDMTVLDMPPLSETKIDGKINQEHVIELGLKNASELGKKVEEDIFEVQNDYSGRQLQIGKHGINHSLDANDIKRLRTNARLALIAGDIVKNAVPINALKNENRQAKGTYAMACLLNNGRGFTVAIVTVNEMKSKIEKIDCIDIIHSINGRQQKKTAGLPQGNPDTDIKSAPATAISKIRIANFLEVVNNTHRSILSKDVLEHFEEKRPADGYYSDRVLFQLRDSNYSKAVSDGDMETAQRLVDEAAKEAGYNSPMLYHGTGAFGFTEFDLSKMDDKRSIFLTDSERIASTYSGVEGKREIGKKEKPIENLSLDELAEELNRYRGESEMQFTYDTWNYEKQNRLIQEVNDGIDKLNELVGEKIKVYAEKLATDFAEGDYKTHRQLVKLKENLENYKYKELSTPIYLLLHMTDVFNENANEIAKLEINIRLMNQFTEEAAKGNDEFIVESGLDGYSIKLFPPKYAKELLERHKGMGNYSLYANLGRSLEIDAEGQVWNNIRNWWRAVRVTDQNTYVKKTDKEFQLIRKDDGSVVEGGIVEINDHNKDFTEAQIHYFLVGKANNTLSILAENSHTTRGISAWAKNWGYDSVVFKGLKDNGGRNFNVDIDETANIYIIFDPNRAKSADPVTYDDNGNVIPLSERFKKENPDIRYSLRESVASFDPNSYNGIRLPKEEYARLSYAVGTYQPQVRGYTSQILDNKNGEPAYIYHVKVEDDGRLIVLSKNIAKNIHDIKRSINNARKKGNIDSDVDAYRNIGRHDNSGGGGIGRQSVGRDDRVRDRVARRGQGSNERGSSESTTDSDERKWRNFVNYFIEDGERFYQERLPMEDRNRLSVLGGKKDRLSKELAVLEKEFGEVIREAYRQNVEPNEGLSERAEKMNAKAAYRLMSEVASVFHIPKETAEEFVLPIIAEMADKGPAISERDGLFEKLFETAYSHTEDYIVDNDPEGIYKNLRNYIRKTPLFVDSGTKADIGDFNSFRKHNMGSLNLVNDTGALSLDEFYDEVANLAPEYFSHSADGAEQLYELSGFMKDRGRTESIGDFMPKEEFVSWAEDVLSPEMDKLFDSTVGTFLSEAGRKETERKRAATVQNAFEAVSDRITGFDSAVKEARAEGVLAGQMSQGKAMAKEMRRKQEEFDRKAKGYEEAIAKKREQIAEVRARRDELIEKARTEKKEAVAKLRREARDRLERTIAEVKAEKREQIQKLRDRNKERQQEIRDKYRDSIKKATEGRHRTLMRAKIRKVVGELNDLLLHQTKEKHVPERMKAAVAKALDILNVFDPAYYDSRIKNLEQRIEQEQNLAEKAKLKVEHAKLLEQREKAELEFSVLKAAYDELGKDGDAAFDPVVAEKIDAVAAELEHTKFKDMSMSQLEQVYELYSMLKSVISKSNKLFAQEKAESAAEVGEKAIAEIHKAGGNHPLSLKATKGIRSFFWNNEKPIYAFERIGSAALTDMFRSIRRGEDVWARDIAEAKDFYKKAKEKYHVEKWDKKKTFAFETSEGNSFELTVQQMMSIYAYSKRKDADKHLSIGGFVFDPKTEVKKGLLKYEVNNATAHNISPETILEIAGKLSDEQRAFADEMQAYLSEVMGAKGNEVSLAMYDVKLFREKNYFPLKSANQYLFEQNNPAGEIKLKNSGFTKSRVPGANNPIILSDFIDVWANHINDMSMYHAFVLPIEDFNRVYNYKTSLFPNQKSVKGVIQNAYGEAANRYISQLITDLNGGARIDSTAGIMNSLIGKFKKASVFASASVVIQQPSAIVRAHAVLDERYFYGFPKIENHRKLWEEVKKYAPVAVIKEMGYFDTNMGRSTVSYIKDEKTVMDRIDDSMSRMPAYADEVSWCAIWNAVKRETKAKNPNLDFGSEEFLKICGERFSEVITRTQVYDSVLSRSANMRSKDLGMKMATAFMAEPTTSINMLEDAVRQAKRGHRKQAAKTAGAVYGSLLLNAALVSLVYAARDDDEDESFAEKYIGSLTAEIIDGFNPLTMIPFIKDAISIMQGYEVDRADMSLVTKVYDAFEKVFKAVFKDTSGMDEEELSEYRGELRDAVLGFAGEAGNLFGIPARNVIRDIKAAINVYETMMNAPEASFGSIFDQVLDSVGKSVPIYGHFAGKDKNDKLYDAIVAGDKTYIERLRAGYASESSYTSAVRKALKENDPRIEEAARLAAIDGDYAGANAIANKIISEGNFDDDVVFKVIADRISAIKGGDEETASSPRNYGMFDAESFVDSALINDRADMEVIREDIIGKKLRDGKTQEEAEKDFASDIRSEVKERFEDGGISEAEAIKIITAYGGKTREEAEELVGKWEFKNDYGFNYDDRADAYKSGSITKAELKKVLMDVGGKTAEEAEMQIEVYDWQKAGIAIESNQTYIIKDYHEFCEPVGIGKKTYFDYYMRVKGITGENKKANRMKVIDSLPLTNAQKDALYYAEGWAKSTIGEAPWH